MKKKDVRNDTPEEQQRLRPALSDEAREKQMIAYATNLAEKQLIEGTASSQVIVHYLKLATTRERLEKEILEKQKEFLDTKTEAIKSAQKSDEIYAEALRAMKEYSGHV